MTPPTIAETRPERLARRLYEEAARLAPAHDLGTPTPWEDLTDADRSILAGAVEVLIERGEIF